MVEKIYIVTGSTDGIGQHTASNLINTPDAKLLVHGRNPAKVAQTVQQLKSVNPGDIDGVVANLASFQDIRRLAKDLEEKIEAASPDAPVVLINNAGVFETRRKESPEGLEMTFAINVAAPFLLTGLLLPLLRRRKNSRIINISSISQGGAYHGTTYSSHFPGPIPTIEPTRSANYAWLCSVWSRAAVSVPLSFQLCAATPVR